MTMTKSDIVSELMSFMREEGYAPKLDDDGDIVFKFESRTYCIIIGEDDTMFYRIVFPNFWPIEDEEERIHVDIAALHACKETKVAKIFPVGDNVWATIETFCHEISSFKGIFMRSLGAIQSATLLFKKKMNELQDYN